jgi:hypothetical protein
MPEAQAEAVAEATRDAITADAATKADIARLETAIERLEAATKAEFANVRHEIATLRTDVTHGIANVRHEMVALRTVSLETRMTATVDAIVHRMTIWLGGLIAVGVAALAAINKL